MSICFQEDVSDILVAQCQTNGQTTDKITDGRVRLRVLMARRNASL